MIRRPPAPPGDMQAVHDRMPVILRPHDFARWLDPAQPADDLLGAAAPETLRLFRVAPRVNSYKVDEPGCSPRYHHAELICFGASTASVGTHFPRGAWGVAATFRVRTSCRERGDALAMAVGLGPDDATVGSSWAGSARLSVAWGWCAHRVGARRSSPAMMGFHPGKPFPGLLALVAVFAISGCASVPMTAPELDADAKAFRPVAGMSTIYLFRDENLGAASPITVSLDDQVAGQTAAWTYLRWIVPPGRHRITSYSGNITSLEIVTEPGELYFVRQDVKLGFAHPHAELRVVDPERGRKGVLASQRVVDLLSAP